MRATIFDRLTQELGKATAGDGVSRRDALRLITGAALGGLIVANSAQAKAKRPRKRKIVDYVVCHNGRTTKVTKTGRRNHLRHGDTPGVCRQQLTCQDGVRNGNETDVDCGGSCPRCATGKTCATRNDCASALCTNGVCQTCAAAADCGVDSDGSMCACRTNAANQQVCTKLNGRFIAGGTCADCRPGEQCTLPPGGAECLLPCGS